MSSSLVANVNKLTPDEVREISLEARLSLSDEELAKAVGYINNFLNMLDRFEELDLTNVAPFSFPEALECPLREDVTEKFDARDEILAESQHVSGDYFKVPRIMEG